MISEHEYKDLVGELDDSLQSRCFCILREINGMKANYGKLIQKDPPRKIKRRYQRRVKWLNAISYDVELLSLTPGIEFYTAELRSIPKSTKRTFRKLKLLRVWRELWYRVEY